MKLSEAIRLGSMLHPQGFDEFYDFGGSTCALGAAGDALGATFVDLADVEKVWPWIETTVARCPAAPECQSYCAADQVENLIPHLNDDHRWTRERIADWVQTIEPAEASEMVESPVTDPAVSEQLTGS